MTALRQADWWEPVEAGYVFRKGEPYRIVHPEGHATDRIARSDFTVIGKLFCTYYRDKEWTPPLDLPTEPTWGVAITKSTAQKLGKWCADPSGNLRTGTWVFKESVIESFTPCPSEMAAWLDEHMGEK